MALLTLHCLKYSMSHTPSYNQLTSYIRTLLTNNIPP